MSIFEVGDVVEVIIPHPTLPLGSLHTVRGPCFSYPEDHIELERVEGGWYKDRFKLVEENKMTGANSKNWGPWIKFTGQTKPDDLDDYDRIQVVYINYEGLHRFDGDEGGPEDRRAKDHDWSTERAATTLAYRVEQKVTKYVLYGNPAGSFGNLPMDGDTHKITYELLGQEVKSCVMEKL